MTKEVDKVVIKTVVLLEEVEDGHLHKTDQTLDNNLVSVAEPQDKIHN